ncbi:MAG: hypothetical protein JEZ04_00735 [Spirochaetales bacterium]|nr:hypothetical protein [Spirochaetales bacterium]
MSKNVVVYYSKNGSNKYLAEKTAEVLKCEALPLRPRVSPFLLLLLASATKISLGNRTLKIDLNDYDSIVLCGPVWMGLVIAPLSDFIRKHKDDIKKLNFITCCGSTDEGKNDKFGYATVFTKIKELLGDKCGVCEAFPVELVLPEDQKGDDQRMMNTILSDSNFTGEIKARFDAFIGELS